MARRKLIWHLVLPYLAITLTAILVLGGYASRSLRNFYVDRLKSSLQAEARVIGYQVGDRILNDDYDAVQVICSKLSSRTPSRITITLFDGTVIGDTHEDPGVMVNHADRPEIRQALQSGVGLAIRHSTTLQQNMLYVAVPIREDTDYIATVRTAIALTDMEQNLSRTMTRLILGGLVTAVLAAILSFYVSHRISQPLSQMRSAAEHFAQGDFNVRVPVEDSDEIGALADSMNWMASQLDEQIQTVQRQNNEQEAVLASMVEGVLAVDTEERVINMNAAAAKLMHIDPEEGAGRSIQEVIRNAELQHFVRRALASRLPVEGDIHLQDTTEIYLQAHGTVLRDAGGSSIGAVIVLHDVTHIRRLENMRRDFVANVSHELRTPITSIKGFVETLLESAPEDAKTSEHFLQIIARQSDRLNAIIEDLLSLSRLEREAERGEVALETGDMSLVLEGACMTCRMKAEEKNITINVDCPNDLKATMNKDLLEQAVVNLLDNAIKYSDEGRKIEIKADMDGGHVTIAVKDEGHGIAEEHLPRLFERFYRVDKARSRKMGGTGLGLSIVKHIAQAHRGHVEVESTLGKGSCFTITLQAG